MDTSHGRSLVAFLVVFALGCHERVAEPSAAAPEPRAELSARAIELAATARSRHGDAMVETLADLVAFRTVHVEELANAENPEFIGMAGYLESRARELGFDYENLGAAVVLGLGSGPDRLGIVTHGDVQPVDPSKWARDPFELDATSEPGRLVGRGAEDDKGAIATAIHAMATLAEENVSLERRVELIVALTEESDWTPFRDLLEVWEPPQLNVVIDSEYPVVTAEKGWGKVTVEVSEPEDDSSGEPRLVALSGGAFVSQVPGDAVATVAGATDELVAGLEAAAGALLPATFAFELDGDRLVVRCRGVEAHSSTPEDGTNAITHLTGLLASRSWPDSAASRTVRFVEELVGRGDYAERFGDVALEHPYMGPLTLALTLLTREDDGTEVITLNLRSPAGRSTEALDELVRSAIEGWTGKTGIEVGLETDLYDPYLIEDAPQIPILLAVFGHYTGMPDPRPRAIGGGTHARLLPQAVNFGPAMPGEVYTGHSEHEFVRRDQLLLNLEMYTAMLVEIAATR